MVICNGFIMKQIGNDLSMHAIVVSGKTLEISWFVYTQHSQLIDTF